MIQNHSIPYQFGLPVALTVITLWIISTGYAFTVNLDQMPVFWMIALILVQTHLFTGLFITAHDGMHGTILVKNRFLNDLIGGFSAGLFMFNFYPKLKAAHQKHHQFVATKDDPDYAIGGFWYWYFSFVKTYVTFIQIVLVAVVFNILKLWVPDLNLILFWVIPSVLSTLQLFYFGTYLPHRGSFPDSNIHKARSFGKQHVLAFLTCYFFGYHYEHHDKPQVPWWWLWSIR